MRWQQAVISVSHPGTIGYREPPHSLRAWWTSEWPASNLMVAAQVGRGWVAGVTWRADQGAWAGAGTRGSLHETVPLETQPACTPAPNAIDSFRFSGGRGQETCFRAARCHRPALAPPHSLVGRTPTQSCGRSPALPLAWQSPPLTDAGVGDLDADVGGANRPPVKAEGNQRAGLVGRGVPDAVALARHRRGGLGKQRRKLLKGQRVCGDGRVCACVCTRSGWRGGRQAPRAGPSTGCHGAGGEATKQQLHASGQPTHRHESGTACVQEPRCRHLWHGTNPLLGSTQPKSVRHRLSGEGLVQQGAG